MREDPRGFGPEESKSLVDLDTRLMLKEFGMNSLPDVTTHSAQTRYDAGIRDVLECSPSGVDLRSAYQIVTKRSRSSWIKMTQECLPTKLRTHNAVLNVCSLLWCPTTQRRMVALMV